MIERARELLALDSGSTIPVTMICADIQDVAIEKRLGRRPQLHPAVHPLVAASGADFRGIHAGLRRAGILISLREDRFQRAVAAALSCRTAS